jgi:hypothetical protein
MSKRLILLFLFLQLFLNSFAQALRQFKVEEIIGLFDKPQNEVYKYIAEKNYSYIGREDEFQKYEYISRFGTVHLAIVFKNSKLSVMATEESFVVAGNIVSDLLENYFIVESSATEVKEFIPHQGCMYGLKNKKLGLLAFYIISKFNPQLVIVNYSRDPKNIVGGSLALKLKALKAGNSK